MKKTLLTLLLLISSLSLVWAADINYKFTNSTVSIGVDEKVYYEFDIVIWADNSDVPLLLQMGQIYIDYNTTTFGEYAGENGKVNVQIYEYFSNDYYLTSSSNFNHATPSIFSVVFESMYNNIEQLANSNENTYITNNSSVAVPVFHVKMEVLSIPGSTDVIWANSYQQGDLHYYYDFNESTYNDMITPFVAMIPVNTIQNDYIFYDGSGDPALPVTMESFVANYTQGAVELEWSTASETQNAGFVLKRATVEEDAALNYTVIGSYLDNDALIGAGTTTEKQRYSYRDSNVRPGLNYSYILEDVDYSGNVLQHDPVSVLVPENVLAANADFRLEPAYPNPFNPAFTLPFSLNRTMDVRIAMYDLSGRQVRNIVNSRLNAGTYSMHVDASDLNSGIYLVRSIIGDQVNTQKMLLVK